MPRKRKTKKRSTHHRRRMGAGAKLNADSPMLMIASAAGGWLLAPTINPALDKVLGTMDEKIKGGIEGGVGAALLFMKLGKKKTVVQSVAGGVLAGAGLKRLLQAFGVINGFQSVPVIAGRMLQGFGEVPVIGNAGYAVPQPLPSAQRVNGVFNGYQVPPVPKSSVMGSMNSFSSDDGGLMG